MKVDFIYENKILPLDYGIQPFLGRTPHMHKEFEIVYVRRGKTMAYADKNSYALKKGDLFIAFPNQIHYYETLQTGEFMVIIFSPSILFEQTDEMVNSVPEQNIIPPEEHLNTLLDGIYTARGKYSNMEISGYLQLIMSVVLQKVPLHTIVRDKSTTFYNLLDYCARHYNEDLTLDTVSEKLHVSKYYISHMINQRLNRNFNEYINNLRVTEACRLLKKENNKIADISEDVGFGTIRSFNRAFKNIMGVSPAEYRVRWEELKRSI